MQNFLILCCDAEAYTHSYQYQHISLLAHAAAGDELTIFYGDKLWFEDTGAGVRAEEGPMHDHMDDEDQFLGALQL